MSQALEDALRRALRAPDLDVVEPADEMLAAVRDAAERRVHWPAAVAASLVVIALAATIGLTHPHDRTPVSPAHVTPMAPMSGLVRLSALTPSTTPPVHVPGLAWPRVVLPTVTGTCSTVRTGPASCQAMPTIPGTRATPAAPTGPPRPAAARRRRLVRSVTAQRMGRGPHLRRDTTRASQANPSFPS
jgi:hypothetical protein